jgi:hypothetical protein
LTAGVEVERPLASASCIVSTRSTATTVTSPSAATNEKMTNVVCVSIIFRIILAKGDFIYASINISKRLDMIVNIPQKVRALL